ncbi:MAG: hypothetical protein AAGA30_01055 [Planctomycetota bacterium]
MKSVKNVFLAVLIFGNAVCFANGQEDNRIFFVKVAKATGLQGQIIDMTELEVTTSFGDITIPFDKIEAVKMRAGVNNSSVIALVNGDMITGSINIDELHLKTNWGKAHIKGEALESISTTQNGQFYTDPNGGGWRYSRGGAGQMMNSPQFGNGNMINGFGG